jgi:hypothetical protein
MPPRIDRLKPVLLLGDGVGQIDDELLSERWTGLFHTLTPKIRVFNLTTPLSRPVRRPPVEKFPLLSTPRASPGTIGMKGLLCPDTFQSSSSKIQTAYSLFRAPSFSRAVVTATLSTKRCRTLPKPSRPACRMKRPQHSKPRSSESGTSRSVPRHDPTQVFFSRVHCTSQGSWAAAAASESRTGFSLSFPPPK